MSRPRPRGALALVLALAALVVTPPAATANATTLTGVDLSEYTRVARHDLDLLAREASGVTYDPVTDTLFVIGDGGTNITQVSKTGVLIDSMSFAGSSFSDTEGIAYAGTSAGKPQLIITEERYRRLDKIAYDPTQVASRSNSQSVTLGTTIGNIGLEGVSYESSPDGTHDTVLVAKEKQPESLFETTVDWSDGTATNGSPTAEEATELFPAADAGLGDFSDVFALSNVSTLTGPDADRMLIISQKSGVIANVGRNGSVSSRLVLSPDPGDTLSIPDMSNEGVTMDDAGNLYVVNEEGGGDENHPQLWVYSPPSVGGGDGETDPPPPPPDTTAPSETVGAAQSSYGLGATIALTCSAADEPGGSGLNPNATNCANVTKKGSDYGVGQHTVTFTATDYAGNTTTKSVTFTVFDDTPLPKSDDGTTAATSTTPSTTLTTTPNTTPTATTPSPGPTSSTQPKATMQWTASPATLERGVTLKLTHLRSGSKITVTVSYGTKKLDSVKSTAKNGKATPKIRLTKKQLANLKPEKITVRITLTDSAGKKHTIAKTIKVG